MLFGIKNSWPYPAVWPASCRSRYLSRHHPHMRCMIEGRSIRRKLQRGKYFAVMASKIGFAGSTCPTCI